MKYYLGIDVGSVSTKLVIMDDGWKLAAYTCVLTHGEPAEAVNNGLKLIQIQFTSVPEIFRVAVTGSGREFIAKHIGADTVKNEVTCQAAAAAKFLPGARTIIEIGGQDSKIILLRDGLVSDFGMNTDCAAGKRCAGLPGLPRFRVSGHGPSGGRLGVGSGPRPGLQAQHPAEPR